MRCRFLAVLALVASLTVGCHGRSASDCPGGKVAPVSPGGPRAAPPASGEALWVADAGGSLRAIDGLSGKVTATVELGRSGDPTPPALVEGGGRLFAYRFAGGDLTLVDAATARVLGAARVPAARPYARNLVFFAQGALWIAQPGHLWRVSSKGQLTSSALPAGFVPAGFADANRWIWLTDRRVLLRISPGNPAKVDTVPLTASVGRLTSGLYATGINSPTIRHLDPDTGREIGSVRLARDELALSVLDGGGQEWAVGNCGHLIRLADRLSVRVSTTSQDLPAISAMGSLWVGDEASSEVVRVDATTGQVLARMPVPAADPDDPSFSLIGGRSTVWVLDGAFRGGVSRVDPTAGRVTRVLPAAPAGGGLSAAVSPRP